VTTDRIQVEWRRSASPRGAFRLDPFVLQQDSDTSASLVRGEAERTADLFEREPIPAFLDQTGHLVASARKLLLGRGRQVPPSHSLLGFSLGLGSRHRRRRRGYRGGLRVTGQGHRGLIQPGQVAVASRFRFLDLLRGALSCLGACRVDHREHCIHPVPFLLITRMGRT
jgi:hypothetical protein